MTNDEEMIDFTDLEDDSTSNELAVVDKGDIDIPDAWVMTQDSMDLVQKQRRILNTKHGMYASTPMICKGIHCPQGDICPIAASARPLAQRCPVEIAMIVELHERYTKELGIRDKDFLDQSLVKQLVDIDIKLQRANGQLSIAADFVEKVIFATDSKGNPFYKPELHKATEYEEKLLKQRAKIINDLNATRRQNASDRAGATEASSFASELMRRAIDAQRQMGAINMPNMMSVTVVDQSKTEGE